MKIKKIIIFICLVFQIPAESPVCRYVPASSALETFYAKVTDKDMCYVIINTEEGKTTYHGACGAEGPLEYIEKIYRNESAIAYQFQFIENKIYMFSFKLETH